MQRHPLAFEAGIVAWIGAFSSVLCVLPRRAAMTISIAIVLGHTWGAATWVCYLLPSGYWWTLAMFLASAIVIVATWEKFGRDDASEIRPHRGSSA